MSHDLTKPYQACACGAHRAMRRRLYKRRSVGRPILFTTEPLGTVRRLQALSAIGYSARRVALLAGIAQPTVSELLAGKYKRVTVAHARAVDAIYQRLAMHPAPPSREATYARNRAQSNGWLPPLVWDDIDDPHERPKGVRRPCLIAGCTGSASSHGLCDAHYRREQRRSA